MTVPVRGIFPGTGCVDVRDHRRNNEKVAVKHFAFAAEYFPTRNGPSRCISK